MHSTRRRWPSLPPGWRLPTQPPSDRTHLTPGRAETPQGADRPQVRGGTGMEQEQARLRRAPVERFAGTEHVYNLAEIAAQLRAEPHPCPDGHRQMTIAHHGSVALVLFDFEADGRLVDLSLIHISEP